MKIFCIFLEKITEKIFPHIFLEELMSDTRNFPLFELVRRHLLQQLQGFSMGAREKRNENAKNGICEDDVADGNKQREKRGREAVVHVSLVKARAS